MRTILDTSKDNEQASELFSNCFETEPGIGSRPNGEANNALDHNIPYGDDSQWSAMWADNLCGTFTEKTSMLPKRCRTTLSHFYRRLLLFEPLAASKSIQWRIRGQEPGDVSTDYSLAEDTSSSTVQ